jgi:diguanylate cyclase (GGDEF)-like protein/PAS domain S-box-containing protein
MRKHGDRISSEFLARALSSAASAVFITDHRGHIVWVNDAFSRLSGYSPKQAIGRTPSILKSGKQDSQFYRRLWQTVLAGQIWSGEVVERRKDGSFVTVSEIITPLRDDTGHVTHYMAMQHDVTRRKRESDRDHYLAYHDTLTGLSNRVLFLGALQQAVLKARSSSDNLALLYVDVDEFKTVNDTLGHHGGDRLLTAIANRIRASVRKTDLIARLGGDEFCVLQTALPDAGVAVESAAASARKIVQNISQVFVIDGKTVRTSVSVGIAIYPTDATRAEDLLRTADHAMYQAKKRGRNRYQFFSRSAQTQPA